MDNNENAITKKICCSCKKNLDVSNYNKSYSAFYLDGTLPICKNCFGKWYKHYVLMYSSKLLAMQRLCMAFDLFFDEELFTGCIQEENPASAYLKKLNMTQYHGKTFDDSLKGGYTLSEKRIAEERKANINPDDIEKWGDGFDAADYDLLNTHYRLLTESNPQCDGNAEIFIIDLCYTKMQQMRAVREGRVDDYNKLTESYRKTFTQAGLKTIKAANANDEFSVGVTVETIEKYTPAEYYKNKKLYSDHDHLGDYITRFLLRPLRNLMHGTNDRDAEFFVKDEESAFDVEDDT